jgi:hypothetical protein
MVPARCDAGEVICVNHIAQMKGSGETCGDTYETSTVIPQEMRPTDQYRVGSHQGSMDI